MCRSIKPLFHVEPPANKEDMHAAALQFVRKVSGYRKPSKANEDVFNQAVADITTSVQQLLSSLTTQAPLRRQPSKGLKQG